MSILDMGTHKQEQIVEAIKAAAPIVQEALDKTGLQDKEFVKMMQQGISPADIIGLTEEELNALFTMGIQFMNAGQVEKARDIFETLTMLNQDDNRFTYALATTHQVDGNFSLAAKLYMMFLAMEATNVEGYLRVSECLMGAKEFDEAIDTCEIAIALVPEYGTDAQKAHAEGLIATINDIKAQQE
ncbi:MAG: hypothetical protein AAGE61_17240 [Pseudomonadota bacterium]